MSLFTGAPRAPFVSPDGQWVGFVDGTSVLKKVAITGGPPFTIASLDGMSRGATWTPDDTIVFATNATTTGLQQVAAGGGPTTVLTRPNRARGDDDHLWPEQLPGGRAVLFTILPVTGGLDAAQVAVLDRQTGMQTSGGARRQPRALCRQRPPRLRRGQYAPRGGLRSRHARRRGDVGPGRPGCGDDECPGGGVDAVVAADGTLAYVRGVGAPADRGRSCGSIGRDGRRRSRRRRARMSTRGSVPRAAVWCLNPADGESDLWVWDVARLTLTRLTFNPGGDLYPVWTPDGRRLIFSSQREGAQNLFWQAADGTGAVERLTRSPNVQ